MKNGKVCMARLAAKYMFDLDATAAQNYMEDVSRAARLRGRRDVSPEAAFKVAGDFLWRGLEEVEQRHPELLKGFGAL